MSEEEKYRLIKVGEFNLYDFCFKEREICKYCWTDWVKGEPCIFYKRLLVKEDNRVKVYMIKRVR